MKILTILGICAATGLQAATAEVLFYGGDFDNLTALPSERNLLADALVYEASRCPRPVL